MGITTQPLEAVPDQLPRCWIMSQRYVQVLTAAGAVPWVITLLQGDEATRRAIYERLDGLFLPGGVDIDPAAYDEPRTELCGRTAPARDWTELLFTRWALSDRKPVLAVCRGAQLLNVAVGGSLYQDVGAQHPDAIKHDHFPVAGRRRDELAHEARIAPESWLRQPLGTDTIAVNSLHHQRIPPLAPGPVPAATSPPGLIVRADRPLPPHQLLLGR